jgi:hypothetical protein
MATINGHSTSPLTYTVTGTPGAYTIICWVTAADGSLLAIDGIVLQIPTPPTPTPVRIEIKEPKAGETFEENKKFKMKLKVTSGNSRDITGYEWIIADVGGTPVPGTPLIDESPKFRIATAGDYIVGCNVMTATGPVSATPVRIHITSSGTTPPTGPVTINIDSPTGTVDQGTRTRFRASTNPPATAKQYIYEWIFRRRP